MSYVFTDDDYGHLHGVKMQLGLMASMLSKAKSFECDSEELQSTLYALQEPISQVLKTLDERSVIARQSESMSPWDWTRIITLVSGRDSMSVADIVKMDEKIEKAVAIDPSMSCVFYAWRNVMTDDGRNPMMQNRNDMGGFHVKFERTIQPEIPPATEQSVLEMYGAKNARELVKKLVASYNGTPA